MRMVLRYLGAVERYDFRLRKLVRSAAYWLAPSIASMASVLVLVTTVSTTLQLPSQLRYITTVIIIKVEVSLVSIVIILCDVLRCWRTCFMRLEVIHSILWLQSRYACGLAKFMGFSNML